MLHLHVSRRAAVLAVIGLGASLWTGCSDRSPDAFTGPSAQRQLAGDRFQEIHAVLAVHKRHSAALLRLPGVVGTAVGLLPDGKPGLKVLLASPEVRGLPSALEGIPVVAQVTGMLVAFSDPTKRPRPAPMGFSGGHNTIDAAIARSTTSGLGNATPTDDGYGAPSATIFGDANGDHVFDDEAALLGLNVQKYGRTTKLTHGQITGINATVTVCYEVFFGFCIKAARFADQLVIEPGTFSGGGDSGSLIVTDDGSKNPVALLFAGSSAQTIANRIDLVLNRFAVHVDGGTSPPPAPVTDVAITSVTAPAFVTKGSAINVVVTIRNVGNQPVGSFDVTLQDATDNVPIGTQNVAGLVAGASTTRTFSWNTTASSTGSHTLTASHNLPDDNGLNNQATTAVTVNDASNVIHIGDLDGAASSNGSNWSVTVEITVHDANHNPLNGATVVGHWSQLGLNSNTCTTGDMGGNGTCIVLFPSLKRGVTFVNFTVVSVTLPGRTYDRTLNHDVDGSSNGTTVRVNRP